MHRVAVNVLKSREIGPLIRPGCLSQYGNQTLRRDELSRKLISAAPRLCVDESGVEPPHSELGGGGAGGCFEDCEGGALRVGDYGDAADVFEIRGWHVESSTKFFGFASS
jgi:hypothetical protein